MIVKAPGEDCNNSLLAEVRMKENSHVIWKDNNDSSLLDFFLIPFPCMSLA